MYRIYRPTPLWSRKLLSLYKYQINSPDFTINRLFIKLFKTTDMHTIATLQEMFGFALLSVWITWRKDTFIEKCSKYHAFS